MNIPLSIGFELNHLNELAPDRIILIERRKLKTGVLEYKEAHFNRNDLSIISIEQRLKSLQEEVFDFPNKGKGHTLIRTHTIDAMTGVEERIDSILDFKTREKVKYGTWITQFSNTANNYNQESDIPENVINQHIEEDQDAKDFAGNKIKFLQEIHSMYTSKEKVNYSFSIINAHRSRYRPVSL